MRAELVHEQLRRTPLSHPTRVRVPERPSVAATLLALQRTRGNRAVGRMLLQRQPSEAVTATLVMDDTIGVLPLVSFSLLRNRESEVEVIVPSTSQDSDLMRYMADGKKLDHVKISTQNFDLDLDDVYISSFKKSSSTGPDATVSMTLSYRSMKRNRPGASAAEVSAGAQ